MPFFAVRLAFESELTQADTVVEAPDLAAALRMALEDYDWDVCETVSIDGDTFVEHCESFETEDEAEAFIARGGSGALPIPLAMQSETERANAIAGKMLAALTAAKAWVRVYETIPGHEASAASMGRVIAAAIAAAEAAGVNA